MKKSTVVGLCALSAIAGATIDHVAMRYAGREPTPVRENFQYPLMEREFHLKRGEEQTFTYKPGGFGPSYEVKVKYDGILNENGDLAIYLQGMVHPAQVGTPIELGSNTKTGQKIELTPLEVIAEGEDAQGIVHLRFSAPKLR